MRWLDYWKGFCEGLKGSKIILWYNFIMDLHLHKMPFKYIMNKPMLKHTWAWGSLYLSCTPSMNCSSNSVNVRQTSFTHVAFNSATLSSGSMVISGGYKVVDVAKRKKTIHEVIVILSWQFSLVWQHIQAIVDYIFGICVHKVNKMLCIILHDLQLRFLTHAIFWYYLNHCFQISILLYIMGVVLFTSTAKCP